MKFPRTSGFASGIYLLFVVYGSLVPLDFQAIALETAWQRFRDAPFLVLDAGSRADWVANGVLYLPLGLLLARALHTSARLPSAVSSVFALAACIAVALAVEFAQLFFPPRTVSQNDVIAEVIGSAIGAALAPLAGGWSRRLVRAMAAGGPALVTHLLEAYAVAYLALCFFPYDLLLSLPELNAKLASGGWGWILARSDRGLAMVLLQLLVEAALCAPMGALLARRGVRLAPAVVLAALVSALIELGQFFIVSGISQGASVVSRVSGVALGVALAPRLVAVGWDGVRAVLGRAGVLVLIAWLPAMLYVNGWFRSGWQGAEAAAATWREVRLLPFYYHYYTSEAVALFSLGTVALMYQPLAAVGWARRWSGAAIVAAVALAALAAEASKLFLAGMKPDPTNILIAGASAWLLLRLLAFARQPQRAAGAGEDAVAGDPVAAPAAWPWLAVVAALVGGWLFPAFGLPLVLGLAAVAALVAWRPAAALLLVPAALPLLDLAPWSGLRMVDEFDLLMLAGLGAAFARTRPRPASAPDLRRLAWWLVAAALVIATARALWPWPAIGADSFAHPTSPWMALRIVKGALWAWLFVALWQRLDIGPGMRQRLFALGMAAGLLGTVLCIVWERLAFGVLTDFAADLRVTGLFSAMSKGGAFIECFLAVAMAFVLSWLLGSGTRPWQRAVALALFAAAAYALMVTYSRNGYAALAVVLLVMVAAAVMRRGAQAARAGWIVLVLVVATVVVVPIALAPLASGRLDKSLADLQLRQRHWSDALALREPDLPTALFGEGLGRFPDLHYWRTKEPVRAASFRLARDAGNDFLRLGPGAPVYLEQIVRPAAARELVLRARLRAAAGPVQIGVTLCEKWTLTSLHCQAATLAAASLGTGVWHEVEARVQVPAPVAPGLRPRLPVKFSLMTPAGNAALDIDDLRLLSPQGDSLLANGDFAAGLNRWYFATDVDPPWHIHSLPLALLFDQGWFGLVAWALVLAASIVAALRRLRAGDADAAAALAALLAFLTSGVLNTLIDEPRFLFLLLVLAWLAGRGPVAAATRPPRAGDRLPVDPGPRAPGGQRVAT